MLEIQNITKEYFRDKIINNFSLKASPGEIICLKSLPSAGKLFCELLVGLQKQLSGSISINTYDMVFEPQSAKKLIGYVPKGGIESNLLITGKEFLFLTNFLYNGNDPDGKVDSTQQLNYLLSNFLLTNIDIWLSEYIKNYSEEQKHILGLFAALFHQPKLLVLEQPFTGIGEDIKQFTKKVIVDYAKKQGTVIFTMTDAINPKEFFGFVNRTVLLNDSLR
jgi:ABC-type multidrug transport system ATPase subunit